MPVELESNNVTYTLAFSGEEMIGYAKLTYDSSSTVTLDKLYFLNGCKGKGYGSALLQHCIHQAVHRYKQSMTLGVYDKNASAISFYEKKMGFHEIGKKWFEFDKTLYGNIVMGKSIDIAKLAKQFSNQYIVPNEKYPTINRGPIP